VGSFVLFAVEEDGDDAMVDDEEIMSEALE
jgi:hypothetical protein